MVAHIRDTASVRKASVQLIDGVAVVFAAEITEKVFEFAVGFAAELTDEVVGIAAVELIDAIVVVEVVQLTDRVAVVAAMDIIDEVAGVTPGGPHGVAKATCPRSRRDGADKDAGSPSLEEVGSKEVKVAQRPSHRQIGME